VALPGCSRFEVRDSKFSVFQAGDGRRSADILVGFVKLAEMRKGAWEKEVLAWWLCQHTTARRRWVSERLGMGDESRVTQAIGRMKRKGPPELERLKRRLEQVNENRDGEVEV
jgi:hypothetical protein